MQSTDRRALLALLAAGAGLAATPGAKAQAPPAGARRPVAAMLVHNDMIALDLIGPQTMLNIAGAEIHLVAASRTPVATDIGLSIMPTTTYADCPPNLDILFVPGGLKGSVDMMSDRPTLDFLARSGAQARYVTSVCTGALLLGAAGLLTGYRATTHWYVHDILSSFGATPEKARVVVDRNRITGGGVTAGLDFGLTLVALLRDDETARRIQLLLEYDPQPPFSAGSPAGAGPTLTQDVLARRAPAIDAARKKAQAFGPK